jgi:hypothetical protein
MTRLDEVELSKTIVCTDHEKLLDCLASDVAIELGAGLCWNAVQAGATPLNLTSAHC